MKRLWFGLASLVLMAVVGPAGCNGCGGHAPLGGAGGGAGTTSAAGGASATGAAGHAGTSGAAGAPGAGGFMMPPPSDGSATLPDGRCIQNASSRDGVCRCDASTPTPCDAVCVDLQRNNDHCGTCDRACSAVSACADATCSRPPSLIRSLDQGCGTVDVDAVNGTLYWTEAGHGTVNAVDLNTGAFSVLSSAEKTPTRVSVRGDNVFWLNAATNTIREMRGAGAAIDLVASAMVIRGYVVSSDGASVYYSTSGEIDEVDALGAAPKTVVRFASDNPRPTALALDGNSLAVADAGEGFVELVTLVAGKVALCDAFDATTQAKRSVNCVRIGQGIGSLLEEKLVLAAGTVIWADGGNLNAAADVRPTTLRTLAGVGDPISGFTVRDATIYVAAADLNLPNPGAIYRVFADGSGTPVPIARGQVAPRGLAVDDIFVYWSTPDCAIRAVDR